MYISFPSRNKKTILALGAESSGNFSIFKNGKIYLSADFGDLLDEKNWNRYQKDLFGYLKEKKLKPDVILTDLHPLYKNTNLGKELSKKYKAKHILIQHHIAHIFSSIGDKKILNTKYKIPDTILGIACDGTGFGLDEKIWGGEIFQITKHETQNAKLNIERIGHLENQTLIGGDLAIKEPARILISILSKFLDKKEIYKHTKKYYSQNEFELLYNQLRQNFNCQETSSTGRILDAVSILLEFCGNKRNYKHEPIELLEKNSSEPYLLKPKIVYDNKEKNYILLTTPLFEYLVKNIAKNKKRLAATAQFYIAQGLHEMLQRLRDTSYEIQYTFFAGGLASNKIISSYLESKGVYTNKKVPRGDAGLSLGQAFYFFLTRK